MNFILPESPLHEPTATVEELGRTLAPIALAAEDMPEEVATAIHKLAAYSMVLAAELHNVHPGVFIDACERVALAINAPRGGS